MKLLYISNLTGNLFAGPNYSVPAQIAAQSKYDEVFWLNLNNNEITNDKAGLIHKISDIKGIIPDDLPEPFNKPDLVVFEEFYCYPFNKIIYRLVKSRIPYVIIPRSQMTHQAKQIRKIKKKVADLLFFDWFVKNASAIHYLTETEKNDSSEYGTNAVVIPNGINMPVNVDYCPSNERFIISYVGRLNIYQKGIDLLFEACGMIRDELIRNHVKICFYGPDQEGALNKMIEWRTAKRLEEVVEVHGAVYDDQKADILTNSDAFIMTSRFEGMPMGLIEALSYGLPCIVTPGTNLMQEIEDAGAGFGCDLSAKEIADAMMLSFSKRIELLEMRTNAKKLAACYSWDGIAERTHRIYGELLID